MRMFKQIASNFRHPSFAIGFALSAVLIVLALLSLVWTPHPTDSVNIAARFGSPSLQHVFGTDFFGRDIFSMLMAGALTSLRVAVLAVGIGMVVGVPLGLLAAGHGGWLERLILRFNDFVFAFPAIITAIIITTLFGPSAINAMIAIGIFNIPVFARVARGGALSIWTLDYVDAARLSGLKVWQISMRHVLPNILSLLIVQATIQLSLGILAEAGLSYIGLGTQPPETSLGLMLKEAQSFFLAYPMQAVWPGLTIITFVMALNLMGDGLRDQMDPKLSKAGGINVAG
jgi:peptide/nickel transport system permease protein